MVLALRQWTTAHSSLKSPGLTLARIEAALRNCFLDTNFYRDASQGVSMIGGFPCFFFFILHLGQLPRVMIV